MEKNFRPTFFYFAKPFFITLFLCGTYAAVLASTGLYRLLFTFSDWFSISLLLFAVGLLTAFVWTFGRFAAPLFYQRKVKLHREEVRAGRVCVYHGGLGVGKTLSMTYDGILLAETAEADLRLRELQYQAMEAAGEHFESLDAWFLRVIVRETVEAIDRLPGWIPLLLSNYGIERADGKRSAELSAKFFTQERRAPENAVLLYDEAADDFDNKRVNARAESDLARENAVVNETFSKLRQLYNAYMTLGEQDAQELYIGLRRVVTCNRYLLQLDRVCEPVRLLRRYDKLAAKVLKHDYCPYRTLKILRKLDSRIRRIGFFRIAYRDDGNTQQGEKGVQRGYYVLPKLLDFRYETRAYVFDNAALDRRIDLKVCESLYKDRKAET